MVHWLGKLYGKVVLFLCLWTVVLVRTSVCVFVCMQFGMLVILSQIKGSMVSSCFRQMKRKNRITDGIHVCVMVF